MTFQDLFQKYIIHSTCNEDQARFIWNNAIEEATKLAETHLTGDHKLIKKQLYEDQNLEQYF